MATPTSLHLTRQYSNYAPRNLSNGRFKGAAIMGYSVAAFTLPFLPPYLASKRSEGDASGAARAKREALRGMIRPLH